MKIFNGKKEAEKILKDLKKKIEEEGKKPVLSIICVGKNPESELYIKNKKTSAKKVGIIVFCYRFDDGAKEEEIIRKIEKLNRYPSVHGIIVQLPLPKKFNTDKIINSVIPEKDVDGFHRINRELLKEGKSFFSPVLPSALSVSLKKAIGNSREKKIVALTNSDIFGETLKIFFEEEGIKIKYLVGDPGLDLKKADVVISVCGKPNFIKENMIKTGAILIDAGIRVIEGKIIGDIDKESVKDKASFLSPVPGGIGPLTVAFLLKNTYSALKNYDTRN